MKKKILAIILARGNSKRIKNKNIKIFKKKPLISWTLDVAKKINYFHDILVSSDSPRILKISKSNNKKIIVLKRPQKFSSDKSSSESAILHAVKWYEKKFSKIDYIALLQPTSPFRTKKTINIGINKIINSKLNAVIAVKKTKFFSDKKKTFYITSKNFCKKLNKDHKLKQKYKISGVFYLIKKSFFIKNKDFSPAIFKPIIINSKKENIDIDTNQDWSYAKKFT